MKPIKMMTITLDEGYVGNIPSKYPFIPMNTRSYSYVGRTSTFIVNEKVTGFLVKEEIYLEGTVSELIQKLSAFESHEGFPEPEVDRDYGYGDNSDTWRIHYWRPIPAADRKAVKSIVKEYQDKRRLESEIATQAQLDQAEALLKAAGRI